MYFSQRIIVIERTQKSYNFCHKLSCDDLQVVKTWTCHLVSTTHSLSYDKLGFFFFFFCVANIFHDIGFKVLSRTSNTSTIKIGINLCHNLPRGNCGTKLCHFQRYWHYSSFVFVVNDIADVTENSIQVLKS